MEKKSSDLSKDEDLTIGVMNLISLEEHAYFSYMKTNDPKYLHLLNSVRHIRTTTMKRLVDNPQGEEWCMSKHLLAASMRLYETGTKELKEGKTADAQVLFEMAFELFALFFGLKRKIALTTETMKIEPIQEQKFSSKLSAIIKKIVDCCKE